MSSDSKRNETHWKGNVLIAGGTFTATVVAYLVWQRALRRITSADYVTPEMLNGKRTLRGRVVRHALSFSETCALAS